MSAELYRYVVLNAVGDFMVRSARDWARSNHWATVGMALAPKWLKTEWTLAALAEQMKEA